MAGEIIVGSVAVGVVPDARGWNTRLRAELVPSSSMVGEEVGRVMGERITSNMGKAGEESAGAFDKNFKKRLKAALAALPKADIKADSTEAEIKIQKIRRLLEELSHKKIGMDFDTKLAMEELAVIETELGKIEHDAKNIDVRFNTATAKAQLALLKRDVGKVEGGGILSTITRLIPGFGPGLGGAGIGAGGQGASGAASAASGAGGLLTNPYALGGAAAAVAGIAPFAGQAGAGALIGGLGAGLAGLGILGALYGNLGKQVTVTNQQMTASQDRLKAAQQRQAAAQDRLNQLQKSGKATVGQLASAHASLLGAMAGVASAQNSYNKLQEQNKEARQTQRIKDMRNAWTDLGKQAKQSLAEIGAAFVPVMTGIFNTAKNVMKQLTPVFAGAEQIIAGPFQTMVDVVLKAFTRPAVVKSIQDVANAFADIMMAFTPMIPKIADSLAQAISGVADAVAKNPRAIADFIAFLFQIVIGITRAIQWLTLIADWIEAHWAQIWTYASVPVMGFVDMIKVGMAIVSGVISTILSLIQGHWGDAWNHIKDTGIRIWNAIKDAAVRLWHALDEALGKVMDTLGHNIAAHFDEIRHNLAGWGRNVLRFIRIVWNDIYGATIGVAIRIGHDIERIFTHLRHSIANIFNGARHEIAHIWDIIYNNTIGAIIRLVKKALQLFSGWKTDIVNFFSNAINWLLDAGKNIIRGLANGLAAIWTNVSNWFKGIPNKVSNFFSGALNWLLARGKNIITGLWNGIKAIWTDVSNWFKGMPGKILSALGIKSPPQWAIDAGKHIMQGLLKSFAHGAKDVKGFFVGLASNIAGPLKSVWGSIGGFFSKLIHGGGGASGVVKWAGLVNQALAMLHLPASLAGQVLYQMQTESGGDPDAINLTDINAQMGDPSKGLLQVIGATFAAFHVPGTSYNIFDPLANIAAAIAYAFSRYGPTLMRGGMGMGSGHGYDSGGWLPPGVTLAYNMTGRPERVLSHAELGSGSIGGTHYHAHFDGLTGATIDNHVRTAFQAMSVTAGSLGRQGRRT